MCFSERRIKGCADYIEYDLGDIIDPFSPLIFIHNKLKYKTTLAIFLLKWASGGSFVINAKNNGQPFRADRRQTGLGVTIVTLYFLCKGNDSRVD